MTLHSRSFTKKFPVLYWITDKYGRKVYESCNDMLAIAFDQIEQYDTIDDIPWDIRKKLIIAMV